MLRTLVLALMLAAPGLAAAEQFPESPLGQRVVGRDGVVLGRVEHVERDADGNIVAVEIPGLEPGDAPRASPNAVAEAQSELMRGISERRERQRRVAVNTEIRIR